MFYRNLLKPFKKCLVTYKIIQKFGATFVDITDIFPIFDGASQDSRMSNKIISARTADFLGCLKYEENRSKKYSRSTISRSRSTAEISLPKIEAWVDKKYFVNFEKKL